MWVDVLAPSVTLVRGLPSGAVPRRLVGAAGALTAVLVGETVVRVAGPAGLGGGLTDVFAAGALTSVPFLLGLVYVGEWLDAADLDLERHGRVWWWTTGGAGAFLGINLVLMLVLPVASELQAVGWLRWGIAVGAGVGALIGVTEARAVQNATDAASNRVRAEHLERERDRLDYLNSLLRHEVLNATNEISGYASLLREDHEPGSRNHEFSDRIDERTEALTSVIDDVRVLLQASREPDAVGTVDATAVVDEEAARLTAHSESASVSVDAPDEAPMAADQLVSRAVRAVMENAVEHDDADETSVTATVEAESGWVAVRVTDDGSGISEETRESLFQQPSRRTADHPLGLYIAAKLVEGYGGEIRLVETGDQGSTFELRLPEADTDRTATQRAGSESVAELD